MGNRKAKRGELTWPEIIGLIIVAISALVLFTVFIQSQGLLDKFSNLQICKASTFLAAKTPGELIQPQCPSQIITITPKGAYRASYLRPERAIYINMAAAEARVSARTGRKPTKVEAMQELYLYAAAREMADCWEKFGEGKLSVFGSKWFIMRKYDCILCSVMEADRDFIREFNIAIGAESGKTISDFLTLSSYLNGTTMPRTGVTYADYLAPKVPSALIMHELKNQVVYVKDYGILLINDLNKNSLGISEFGAGAVQCDSIF
jgi:hypothetical protein